MSSHHEETLFDYKGRLSWVRHLGWTDDQLRKVPVHREQTIKEPFISLPLDDLPGKEGIPGLYVFQSDVDQNVWQELIGATSRGAPSGTERHPLERDQSADNIPRPY